MADTDYLAASDGTGNAALMHITSPRTALATIIQVDTVTGVPAFFIGTWGTLGADGFITQASARDFFGHVNAGTLVIDKMAPGNVDGGNTAGQVVVIKPSTQNQNLISTFIKTALSLFPNGYLLNGQIVPSVSSNNLIVALKTLNNVDPSTTDPVYVRINNVIRQITAPLSVTLAAGTSWFGKGASYFGGAESDFFVYLGYNTNTSAVQIAISSDPNMRLYSDFSTTNTNWNYFGGTGTAPAATNVFQNVGRFNAILGVTATFLWSLPATIININEPTYETRVFTATNSASAGGTICWQQRRGRKEVWGVTAQLSGTGAVNLNFPTGFFTAITSGQAIANGPYVNTNVMTCDWASDIISNLNSNSLTPLVISGASPNNKYTYALIGS